MNGLYSFGSRVEFACMSGYILEGPMDSICLNEKIWSSEIPKCITTGEDCFLYCEETKRANQTSVRVKGLGFSFVSYKNGKYQDPSP